MTTVCFLTGRVSATSVLVTDICVATVWPDAGAWPMEAIVPPQTLSPFQCWNGWWVREVSRERVYGIGVKRF